MVAVNKTVFVAILISDSISDTTNIVGDSISGR